MKNRSIEAKPVASSPVETKVVAAVGGGISVGGIVSLVFGLAAVYHWFTPPPPYLTALAVTVLSGLLAARAGWKAPHTSRLKPLTPSNLTIDELAGLAHAIGAEVVMATHPTSGTALPVVTAKTPPDLDVTQGYTTPPAQPPAGNAP